MNDSTLTSPTSTGTDSVLGWILGMLGGQAEPAQPQWRLPPGLRTAGYIQRVNEDWSRLHRITFRWLSEPADTASYVRPGADRLLDSFIVAVRRRACVPAPLTITFLESATRLSVLSIYDPSFWIDSNIEADFRVSPSLLSVQGAALEVGPDENSMERACLTLPLARPERIGWRG